MSLQGQELNSMSLVGPCQLRTFAGSMKDGEVTCPAALAGKTQALCGMRLLNSGCNCRLCNTTENTGTSLSLLLYVRSSHPCASPACSPLVGLDQLGGTQAEQVQGHVSGWSHQCPALGSKTWSPMAWKCERRPPWSPYLWMGLSLWALEAIRCSAGDRRDFPSGICATLAGHPAGTDITVVVDPWSCLTLLLGHWFPSPSSLLECMALVSKLCVLTLVSLSSAPIVCLFLFNLIPAVFQHIPI